MQRSLPVSSRSTRSSTGLASCTSSTKTCAKRIGLALGVDERPAQHLPAAQEERARPRRRATAPRRRARPRRARAPAARTTRAPGRAAPGRSRGSPANVSVEQLARRQELVPQPRHRRATAAAARPTSCSSALRVTSGSADAGADARELPLAGEPRARRPTTRASGRALPSPSVVASHAASDLVAARATSRSPARIRASTVSRDPRRRAASIAAQHRRVRLGARDDRRRLVAHARRAACGKSCATRRAAKRANVVTGTPSTPSDGRTRAHVVDERLVRARRRTSSPAGSAAARGTRGTRRGAGRPSSCRCPRCPGWRRGPRSSLRDEVELLLVEHRRDGRQVLVLPQLAVGPDAEPRRRRDAVPRRPLRLGLEARAVHARRAATGRPCRARTCPAGADTRTSSPPTMLTPRRATTTPSTMRSPSSSS